jgi:octaprenyl-diphosphate synthase
MLNSTDISQATFVWQEILEPVRADLEQVEARFHEKLVSSVPEVTQIGQYLQVSGGKRLRPALLLMTARMFGKIQPSATNLGAVVEMIHTATLVHDDVIDGADRRRGRPSTNSRWGNHTSVLAGDWLYMQAFRLAVEERNFQVLDILIELTQQMVEGELIQWGMIGRLDISREAQLDLIFRKTACLFSACTRLGAVVCGQSAAVEEQLATYGTNLGMAFQLVDDLLDFTATEELLGKPVGSDLREGKVTLPLIHVLERCTPSEHALVSKVMEERAFHSVAWDDLLALLWRYEAPQAVKALAQDYAAKAVNAIESLASANLDKRARQTLAMLPELFVHRQY